MAAPFGLGAGCDVRGCAVEELAAGRLRLTLDGAPGEIAARGLQDALSHLMVLVRDAGKLLNATAGVWTVSRLELGSVLLEIENPAAVAVPVMIDHGFEVLSQQAVRPDGWSLQMLKAGRDLGRLAGRHGIRQVRLATSSREHDLGGPIASNADLALTTKHQALGSVRGHLDKWSERGGRRDLGMILEGGEPLSVTYPDDLGPQVLALLAHDVEAWGMVDRNAAGQRIRLQLEGIEAAQPRGRVVPVHEVSGLYSGLWPADMTVADILREVRGE